MFDSLVCFVLRRHAALHFALRQRCTPPGRMVLGALVGSAALGLDTNRNLAYQFFTLMLALVLVALLGVCRFRPRLQLERALPRIGTVGETLRYRIRVVNQSKKTSAGVELREQQTDPHPGRAVFHAACTRGESLARRWRRLCGSAAWQQEQSYRIPDLSPGAAHEAQMSLIPMKRGRLHLDSLDLMRLDPLGLFKAQADAHSLGSCLILPRRYVLPALDLPGNRAVLQGSRAVASSVADAEEFQSLRDYRPGDPLRLIHWKSWARSGKPVIREFQDEYSVRHALILDTFAAGEADAVFEEAVSLAASFACTVDTRESLLDLLFVGAEVYRETIGRGHGPVERLLEVLAGVQPCGDKPFQYLHNAVLAQHAALSGCICVLLRWDTARQNLVQQLARLGVPQLIFVLTDAAHSNLLMPQTEMPLGVHLLEVGRIGEDLAAL